MKLSAFYAYPSSFIADHHGGDGWYFHRVNAEHDSLDDYCGPFDSAHAAIAAGKRQHPTLALCAFTAELETA